MTEYVVKVRRYAPAGVGEGESVIGWRVPLGDAKQIVSDWNTQYQTDTAFYEEYDAQKLEGWSLR